MSDHTCGWLEEEVVDYVLGRMDSASHERFSRHLNLCERCAALHREWTFMLAEPVEQPKPSPALPHRLRRSVLAADKRTRLFRCLRARLLVPTAAVFALMLFAAGSLSGDVPFVATRPDVLKEQAMMMDPRTVVHVAVPVVQTDASGYVWINDNSNEILFLANGLEPFEEKDYQVWLIMENGPSNVGVLQWRDGMAHLYFQGEEVRRVKNITVSLEPKGGSFVPTGPETMYVRVKHASE